MQALTLFEVITIVVGCVQALGTVAAFVALVYTVKQLRDAVQWNRLNAAMTYLDVTRLADIETKAVGALLEVFEIDFNDHTRIISQDEAKQILDRPTVYEPIKQLLNFLEFSSAAIASGAVDEEFAYSQLAHYFKRVRTFFENVMIEAQARKNNIECWGEFNKLEGSWEGRRQAAAGHGGVIEKRYG
jgi:hypothetical protein